MPQTKLSVSSVRGKIIVFAADGEKIGQWGGTECCLSRETGVGPVLVVRSSKHKRGQGTLFKLSGLKRVNALYAHEGKMSIVIHHKQHVCTVSIATTEDVEPMRYIAATLQQPTTWESVERDVLRPNLHKPVEPQEIATFGGGAAPTQEGLGEEDPQNQYQEMVQLSAAEQEQQQHNMQLEQQVQQQHEEAAAATAAEATLGKTVTLTEEQQLALNRILQGSSVFVTGSAGTGKTEWLRHIISRLPQDDSTVVTATTGVAARRVGGTTVHSFSGIGLGDGTFEEVLNRVKSRPEVVRSWTRCRRWIIDEVGMLSGELFTLLDHIARAVKKHTTDPFGGIQMILVGDFLQLPPVSKSGVEAQWCFESPSWRLLGLRCTELKQSFRHINDRQFEDCLRDVRLGEYTGLVEDILKPAVNRDLSDISYGVVPTRIMSLNAEVDRYNDAQLAQIDAPFERYFAEDHLSVQGIDMNNEVPLVDTLTLKEGAQVVLIASLPNTHLRNGDSGIVTGFAPTATGVNLPIVRFTTGEEIVVAHASMDVTGRGALVLGTRKQLPLRLGWALTVHRTQGMTIPFVEIALNRSFFEYGQAYTALSRVRSSEHLRLTEFDPSVIKAHPKCIQAMSSLFPLSRMEREKQQQRAQEEAARKRLMSKPTTAQQAPTTTVVDDQLAAKRVRGEVAPAAPVPVAPSPVKPRRMMMDDE